ncbi:MAG: recombination protein O N-terminal domain-containing protein [Flavobacteriales bacterium]|nr:recombination protein O N-terminal domain-containing protein [Flavobacteriales bacterium]MBP9080687.1 recombination protein O N-terminal domain-containing protein [Flavobacteriales bacterium]
MLHTTRAVVLRTFHHGDRSTVLKAYTETFGARSYMVRTGKRGTAPPALLQPLGRLELVVTEDRDRELQQVREARSLQPYLHIANDPRRGLILLFAQEVFYRTLREGAPDPGLFRFVLHTLEAIDTESALGQLPLDLLTGLAERLGFLPEPPFHGEDRFDLREGCFFKGPEPHAFCMDRTSASAFARMLRHEKGSPSLPGDQRKLLLDHLLLFFRFHAEGFGELRSPEVLHDVLR